MKANKQGPVNEMETAVMDTRKLDQMKQTQITWVSCEWVTLTTRAICPYCQQTIDLVVADMPDFEVSSLQKQMQAGVVDPCEHFVSVFIKQKHNGDKGGIVVYARFVRQPSKKEQW